MSALGVRITLLAGTVVPIPVGPDIAARFRSATITEGDGDRTVFTMTFDGSRSGPMAILDNALSVTSPLKPFARVVLVASFGVLPTVVLDGIVTEVTLASAEGSGNSTFTVEGEDLTYLLDREEYDKEHPALDSMPTVSLIAAKYAARGIVPLIVPPLDMDPPSPTDRVPTQHGTDWEHIKLLAKRHGYVTYFLPGPAPGASTLYWGPSVRAGVPQPALSVDLGTSTNVSGFSVRVEGHRPELASGNVLDRRTGIAAPVQTFASTSIPLGLAPVWLTSMGDIRRTRLRNGSSNTITAYARAQAAVDSNADAVAAEGTLDAARYGGVLRPRGLVGVRGAGFSHDGLWHVAKVSHEIAPGSYTQRFSLRRDGIGSTVPVVRVS